MWQSHDWNPGPFFFTLTCVCASKWCSAGHDWELRGISGEGVGEGWSPITYLQLLRRELMAQLPRAVNNQVQRITWLCCLFLMKLPSNGLIQVLIQLVPGPDALMYIQGERADGVGRVKGQAWLPRFT